MIVAIFIIVVFLISKVVCRRNSSAAGGGRPGNWVSFRRRGTSGTGREEALLRIAGITTTTASAPSILRKTMSVLITHVEH